MDQHAPPSVSRPMSTDKPHTSLGTTIIVICHCELKSWAEISASSWSCFFGSMWSQWGEGWLSDFWQGTLSDASPVIILISQVRNLRPRNAIIQTYPVVAACSWIVPKQPAMLTVADQMFPVVSCLPILALKASHTLLLWYSPNLLRS